MDLVEPTVELIRLCSTVLADDVKSGLEQAREKEAEGSMSRNVFNTLLENVEASSKNKVPMCQDTGAPAFWVNYPKGYSQMEMEEQFTEAVRQASKVPYLRPNAVDAVSGKNSGDNTGAGVPMFHFHEWEKEHLEVSLMLKGGGSENVCTQYKLPDASLGAGRNLEGVRRCVLEAVQKAQGKGCSPGVIGVGIGGNRDTGYEGAKKALLRKLDEENPDPRLRDLEATLIKDLNELGIGPMGFGGKTTVLGVKVAALHRLPACFFVSVAYTCWAMRRHVMNVKGGEISYD